ncbi:hypothetical protein Bca52824_003644 [Brassica carinata]|uniref:Chromatin structure-remodeling complex protein SYD n=1 Tax=Brassica carinata TaxID=52824 RepID=A0A8X7WMG2_BRACI|nr:hypothetical protein Bca52824_003644 [Brassica carinata]
MSSSSHNIELEAAKFLHKLIQDSKDEPSKLATKLYVILQHMKTSGKEHSMPYQVISRAMETVVNQHGLDIEALTSSRLPPAGGSTQMEDSGSAHMAGSSQVVGVSNEPKASLVENEMSKYDAFTSGRQLGGSTSVSQAVFQGPGAPSNRSFDHDSPSSLDSKPGSAQAHDRSNTMNQRDAKSSAKRKRGESSFSWDQNMDNSQQFDTHGTVDDQTRKMSKVEMPATGDAENLHVGLSSDAHTTPQGGWQNSEVTANRPPAHRDTGKSVAEDFRLQLRAQCLVFLALRNGLMPKKLHIDIALGNVFPKDDGFRRELLDQKGRTHSFSESGSIVEASAPSARMDNPTGRLAEMDFSSKETVMPRLEDKISNAIFPDGQKLLLQSNTPDVPAQNQVSGSHSELASSSGGVTKHAPVEMVGWAGTINRNDASTFTFESEELCAPDEEEGNMQPPPKYTMSQKWIMDRQNKRLLVDRSWGLKQQKADQAIGARFNELKESVTSSEDISTKTKSVIELKKLQLLNLQRRLRSEFLHNFFKPIANDVENLKSYKKHKHGRRIRQLEKYEQKMKEERQRRIRERQKEFFGEIEVHKERLDDLSKARRERWKGFNRYVKEFHKRKERFHREKIDKIQREKINLLKINDVEGYLRMVKDAKSDRVMQLLKETEKYLQKLGSKLKEAKSLASRFENEADEAPVEDKTLVENDDESDQAKHYLESNEKYYLMAHSIKENINEQPASLKGGKLREYQMNGLRWLLSLYNNHLNGILADEMGLGKTVQVISLICYLMDTKNDRGPFLVVVPSSVLPGWVSEINFWAPTIQKIVYCGPPEERRKLFKEQIVHQKFNVLLTTYEYLMNKHDRPKLSKILWHYIIIDEGHRIKNASCKLNADLKHYNSSHRLLLTGTPLQNNLEELWALLNFLLPNIFNSSEDFSQWFNKPFQSNGDNSTEEALLSEEENLLIINRLHQVLRPFVLRRLKHKVENELPEKIERLIRCEASAYQKLLMKRVEDNLGSLGNMKSRAVHNSVMELRNICNHPYLSQLHTEEVNSLIPEHYLPPVIRLCGKLEMLDRLLPKLKATDHRVLFFSTMTRLLDVMEDYLTFKGYKYLRLDGHTSGGDRGALIDGFNKSDSPYFIFLLSIRAGGVGVNLQAADTVIIFDTDWNPQVDLQAQARAHRIGQKRDVLVLRFETVNTVEEQVRASAEHKLGVANQSITAGFFDNNTSAEDRNLEEPGTGVRVKKFCTHTTYPSRLVTEDDLKLLYEAMKMNNVPMVAVESNVGMKRKGGSVGGLDTQQYGRGKRAREVRSYEEQMTEEEFEKLCQTEPTDSPRGNEEGSQKELIKRLISYLHQFQAGHMRQWMPDHHQLLVPMLPPEVLLPLIYLFRLVFNHFQLPVLRNANESSIGTQRTNARASLSGDPVASNLATLPVSLVDIDAKVPKPIKGSSSNLESGPSMHSDTPAVQSSPAVSLRESNLLDAPPGFGSGPGSHVQPLNVSEDSLPVNIPSSTALGPAQSQTIAPLNANQPLSPRLVGSTVEAQGASVLSPPAPMPVKRQGRKTPNRGETPRRRGRRHVQASPAADGSSARSTISTPQIEVKVGDSSGSKITSVGDGVVQEQPHSNPSVAHSSASASQEKRKEILGIGGSGRKQTADVTDVARVMKEIFSETSLLKHKVGEPSETTVTNEPDGKSVEMMNMHIAKTSKAENIIQPADQNLGVETISSSVSVEKQKSESSVMVDKTSSDIEASVSHSDDITPQGTMLVDSERPVARELVETEQKVATSTDPNIQIAASVPNDSEENKISGSSMLVDEIVKPSPGSRSPVDQSDDTAAQGTVPVDSKSPTADEDLVEINKESQPPEPENDSHVQSLPTPNADFAEAPNKQAGPSISPSVSPRAVKVTENVGLISKDSSETVPVSSGCVVEDTEMPSASNEHGSPKKPESPEILKSSGADLDCRITPTNSSEIGGGNNFSVTSTEVPENLNDSVTKSCLEMNVSISEKVLENELLTPNLEDLKCVLDPDAKDDVGVSSQLCDTTRDTNLHLNPTNSSDGVSSEKAEIISVGHASNCPPNTSTEGALPDQIVTEETSGGVNNPGSPHFPISEKNLISDVAHPGSGGTIGLVASKDGGTELSVVVEDAGNDLVKIPGVEADSSMVQMSPGDVLPDSIAQLATTEPLPTEQQETNPSIEVKGEEIDGDKEGITPLIPVEQIPTVGSQELETSYEESQGSPMRIDESSHVDSKSFDTTNQTVKQVEAKSEKGDSSAAIQLSMPHTDGLKTQTSNKNSISLVHEDYGSPLSDSANAEQDSGESASVLGVDSCKLGGEASTSDTEMVEASVQLPFSAEQVGGTDSPSSLPVTEGEKAEDQSDERNMIDGEASRIIPSVQPEDLSKSLAETEEPAQMGEVGDASDHSEDNVAVSVLGEKEESKDSREHFSSELSAGEETNAENLSDEKNMIDGEASDMNAPVQPDDLSRSLTETEEPAEMGKVGDASDHSENVAISVLGEKEESKDQQEHLSIALSSEEENKAENPSDDIDMIDGEASGINVSVQPEDLSMNIGETEPTQVGEVGNASDQPEDKEKEESNDQGEHLSSALSLGEETKAENPQDEGNMIDGEASGRNVSVQPEDLSRNVVESEEPTQMGEVGNASDLFEDNVATGVLDEKEQSKDQREPLSSALSSEEEDKAENPSDNGDMIVGEASGINVSVQPEDLSRNVVETEEPTQMGEVGNASDLFEDNVAIGDLEEKEESNDQREPLSSALSSEEENKAENPSDDRDLIVGEARDINVSVEPEDLSRNLVETEESTQMREVGKAGDQSEDNVALEKKKESKDQQEHLSSALCSEEETKAENPQEEGNMVDGEASGINVLVQPEDLSMNLVETDEPTQMEEVGNASGQSEDNVATGVLEEKEELKDQEEHLSSALSSEVENKAENPSDHRDMIDGEASGRNVLVQPENMSTNLDETEEPTQMDEVGNASGQSEDNVAVGVLEEKEESKDQEELLSSALSSEEESKAVNPSEDRYMIDGVASGVNVLAQPEKLSTNLDETKEATQMGEVGNASDSSEGIVNLGVLGEKEESKEQQERLSSALSSEKENEESLATEDPTVGGVDEPEPKCAVSESDTKGDGKKCVESDKAADVDSAAPLESVNSISAAIEASSEPSNSLASEESKSEELKDGADV